HQVGLQELLALLRTKRYEEVLEAWPILEEFTAEAFSAVVEALLALDRPEDVGLFFSKAANNLTHLRGSLHHSVRALAESSQAPAACVSSALRDVFQFRGSLDGRACQELLVAFANMNDPRHAGELVKHLHAQEEELPPGTLGSLRLDRRLRHALARSRKCDWKAAECRVGCVSVADDLF
ncbi:unnamed protein product, partial [Effrenium voratum]